MVRVSRVSTEVSARSAVCTLLVRATGPSFTAVFAGATTAAHPDVVLPAEFVPCISQVGQLQRSRGLAACQPVLRHTGKNKLPPSPKMQLRCVRWQLPLQEKAHGLSPAVTSGCSHPFPCLPLLQSPRRPECFFSLHFVHMGGKPLSRSGCKMVLVTVTV